VIRRLPARRHPARPTARRPGRSASGCRRCARDHHHGRHTTPLLHPGPGATPGRGRGDRGCGRRRGQPHLDRDRHRTSALRHRTFRIVYFGAFASNIGTWMQNVVLGAYAYDLTHSSTFVGVIIFAQLGPALLLLPMVGGLLADKVDRKKFLIILSIEQLVFSLGVAWVVRSPHPSHVLLVLMVLGVGAGAPCSGPPTRPSCRRWWAAGPARRHLAELGPDERLPRHRPGHRRRGCTTGRAGLDLRRQRRDVPLRGGARS
jgi:hypothetical protein